MIRRLGWAVFVILALLPVSARAASSEELVRDGGFEAPVVPVGSYTVFATGTNFDGWTVVGAPGNVSVDSGRFVFQGLRFPPGQGNQSLDITGTSDTATGIEQSLPTAPGTSYVLSFEVGNIYDPGGPFGVSSTIDVSIDGRHVLTATNAKQSRGVQVWQPFSLTFVATSTSTTITFINGDPPSDQVNDLDAVSVVEAGSSASSIASSLPTPAQAFSNPAVVASSVALALGGMLFITFPAQLFNLTFDENYPVIAAWFARRRVLRRVVGRRDSQPPAPPPAPAGAPASPPLSASPAPRRHAGMAGFAVVLVIGAMLGGGLDPRFGLNATTVESVVAVVLALLLGAAIHGVVGGLFHEARHRGTSWRYHALPLGLLVALICVLVSRLTAFQPGYLYGVVAGIAFAGALTPAEQGQVAGLTVLGVMAVSVVAWLIWVPVNPLAAHPDAFPGLIVLDDFLGSVMVGGLVGSAIGMLPLRFLPGWTLLRWNARVWALAFVLAVFAVVDILILSRPSGAGNHAPLVTTVILFVVFSGGSIAMREYFARRAWARSGRTVEGLRSHLRELLSPRPAEH